MGDLNIKIPDWLDNSYLEKVLRSRFPEEDVKVRDFKVEVATTKGDGFASELFRLTVESFRGTFPLLMKKPRESKALYEIVGPLDLFRKENQFYEDFYPAMKQILESVDEFEDIAPEIFYTDDASEVMVIRDLRNEGYLSGDRVVRVPTERTHVMLRKLAKLHAASLAANDTLNGELSKCEFTLYRGSFTEIFRLHIRALGEEMTTWGREFEKIVPKWNYMWENYGKLGDQNIPSDRGLNVLIHADPWFKNMLFKKDDPDAALLIDFQTISWGSLAIDLIHFSITSLNEEDFADREELIRHYHGHLERVLKKLKWQRIPTFEEVLKEYKDKFYQAIYSTMCRVIISRDASEQDLNQLMGDDFEFVRRRFQEPLAKRETMQVVRLLEKYGALDRKIK